MDMPQAPATPAPARPVPRAPVDTDALAGQFTYADTQRAIDEILNLRAKVIRIGLLSTLIYRPDPGREIPAAERQSHVDLLKNQADIFASVTEMLTDARPHDFIDAPMCDWISALAHECPEKLAYVARMNRITQDLRRAAIDGSAEQSPLQRKHMQVARQGFHTAIADLCTHMWGCFDRKRNADLARARTAATALRDRLTRLERIGTHVRLVSLNASVEAARLGDTGRGLSVIAQEFKQLAEEVQAIARLAHGDVAAMMRPDKS